MHRLEPLPSRGRGAAGFLFGRTIGDLSSRPRVTVKRSGGKDAGRFFPPPFPLSPRAEFDDLVRESFGELIRAA